MGDTEPNLSALLAATADVIKHCVTGVDVNDLAIEITKVAFWMEAFGRRATPCSSTRTFASAWR